MKYICMFEQEFSRYLIQFSCIDPRKITASSYQRIQLAGIERSRTGAFHYGISLGLFMPLKLIGRFLLVS
jgi:hypothetical protein